MESSGSPSMFARYRPFILLAAGGAATYGVYLAYSTLRAPRTSLHRSNAVHRRRNRATATRDTTHSVDAGRYAPAPSSPESGHARILVGSDRAIDIHLEHDTLPTVDDFQTRYGLTLPEATESMEALEDAVIVFFVHLSQADPAPHTTELANRLQAWLQEREVRPERIVAIVDENIRSGELQMDGAAEAERPNHSDDVVGGSHGAAFVTTPDNEEGARRMADGQHLKSMLFYIAEDQARQEGYIHRGVTCNSCDVKPIRGVRWRCANCADYDLCSDCEALGMHHKTHIFYKVRIPAPFLGNPRQAQPVLYPGRPNLLLRHLPTQLRRQLCKETKYESSELDALWEQFTSLADHQLVNNDPFHLGAAISRQAFDKAFVPHSAISPPAPNLIYDRMFSFYDANSDGLIDFEEFIKGLAILHGRVQTSKLRMVFRGYDIDGDGLVSRKDFLRMFRAYYAIQKEITRDLIAVQEEDLTSMGALDTIMSSQPLNSAFTDSPREQPERQMYRNKPLDRFGDIFAPDGVTRSNGDDTGDRRVVIYEAADGRNSPVVRMPGRERFTDRLYDRWRRRDFYTDFEEGFAEPEGYETESDSEADNLEAHLAGDSPIGETPNGSRPMSPRSRSSSKVRFQDDLEFDSRSNASTSSRPVGERWGGYEIPEAEKDIGKEVLYQVTQQGFNELLDPLFKDKEDLAVEVKFTITPRKHWKAQISEFLASKDAETELKIARASKTTFLVNGRDDYSVFLPNDEKDKKASALSDLFNKGHIGEDEVEEARGRLEEVLHAILVGVHTADVWEMIDKFFEHFSISSRLSESITDELYTIADGRSVNSTGVHPTPTVRQQALEELSIRMGTLDELLQRTGYEITGENGHRAEPTTSSQPNGTLAGYEDADRSSDSNPLITDASTPYRDPTFPQFRPNSQADLERTERLAAELGSSTATAFPSPATLRREEEFFAADADATPTTPSSRPTFSSDSPDDAPRHSSRRHGKHAAAADDEDDPWYLPVEPPSHPVLARLALLERESQQIRERGGGGRLDFDEFEYIMRNDGKGLGFVEQWLEVGSF